MATGIPNPKSDRLIKHQQNLRAGGQLRLDYEGRRSPSEILATRPKAKLAMTRPPRHSEGWANKLYFAENMEILGALMEDPSVHGQVSLIYIDPPYATNSVFESREQKIAYHDLLGGADFVEFLRERLVLLRELLSERGSIYVHLDENMAFPMKLVMDEIFGADKFRNFITRKKCNTKNYTHRTYGNISDYILFYSKTDTYTWNRPLLAWSEKTAKKEYTYLEAATGRRFKKVPLHAPGVRNGATGKLWREMSPPPGKHWQFPPQCAGGDGSPGRNLLVIQRQSQAQDLSGQ
jgi:adenine-specific DNA-methyltransferase